MDVVATDAVGRARAGSFDARRVPRNYLHRDRLSEYLDSDARVVLAVAPAGTGKTTAIAGWSASLAHPVRWIDFMPNRPAVALWETVGNAFGVLASDVKGEARGGGGEPVGDIVVSLCDDLDRLLRVDHVLVIDGLDDADEPVLAGVELFLRRLPTKLRVVIASRQFVPLQLDAIRMRGDLLDLGYDDLRFTSRESSGLVRELAPSADDSFVDALTTWADGWAAPLAFGAMAWRKQKAVGADITAVQQAIHDYVCGEMVASEDGSLVAFLLDIAVVGQVTASLSNAITEDVSGAAMLRRAEERGMFVSRVGIRGWYELQPTFRETLVHEAERRDIDRTTACRRRAATWLEQSGETVDAMQLWLQVGDSRAALRLLAKRHVELYEAGLQETIRECVEAITRGGIPSDVGDLIDLTSCQVFVDRAEFLRGVDETVWWANRDGHIGDQRQRQVHALQAVAALVVGDFERGRTHARLAVDGCETWWSVPIVRTAWNDLARCSALDERWDVADDTVREITIRLRREPVRTLVLEATRSLGEALAGRPIDSLRIAAGVRSSVHVEHLPASRAELRLADVIARREIGDAPDARDELERLVDLELEPTTCVRGLAALELAQLHLDRGAIEEATSAFDVLERLVADQLPGPAGALWVARIGTSLALERGDYATAQRHAASIDDAFWGPFSRARVSAAVGGDDVTTLLREAAPRCPKHHVMRTMLMAGTSRDREAASELAERAVLIAYSNGMLQTLGSTGQFGLIERAAWRLPSTWIDRLRRATTATIRTQTSTEIKLVEPLTVRERDVLRFLPSRLTLKEIAEELYISVNTLKFHLKVIYRKLGVNSRAEAADFARSWGRIEHD